MFCPYRGFTLTTFATILGKQLGVAPEKLQKRLWGDNFYDPDVKKWCAATQPEWKVVAVCD